MAGGFIAGVADGVAEAVDALGACCVWLAVALKGWADDDVEDLSFCGNTSFAGGNINTNNAARRTNRVMKMNAAETIRVTRIVVAVAVPALDLRTILSIVRKNFLFRTALKSTMIGARG